MYQDDETTQPGLPPDEPTMVGPRPFNAEFTMIGMGSTGYALEQLSAAQAPLNWDDDVPTRVLDRPTSPSEPPVMSAEELLGDVDERAERAMAERLAAEPNLPKVQVLGDGEADGARHAVTRKMPRVLVARTPVARTPVARTPVRAQTPLAPMRPPMSTPVPVVTSNDWRPSESDLAELGVPRRRGWAGGIALAAAAAIAAGVFALAPFSSSQDPSSAVREAGPVAAPEAVSQGVRLSCPQPGVRLTIDGDDHGPLPANLELDPGSYTLRLEGEGLVPFERTLQVNEGTMIDLGAVELSKAGRTVTIAGVPNGARVLLVSSGDDGSKTSQKVSGPFPRSVDVPADGDWKLVSTLAGHHHFVHRLTWAKGESDLDVAVELLERAGARAASIDSSAADVDAAGAAEPEEIEEEIDDPYADDEPLVEGPTPIDA